MLTDHRSVRALDTLGAAYAASGDFERAIATVEAALEIAECNRASRQPGAPGPARGVPESPGLAAAVEGGYGGLPGARRASRTARPTHARIRRVANQNEYVMLNSQILADMISVGFRKFGPERRVTSMVVFALSALKTLARTANLCAFGKTKVFSTRRSSWLLSGSWRDPMGSTLTVIFGIVRPPVKRTGTRPGIAAPELVVARRT